MAKRKRTNPSLQSQINHLQRQVDELKGKIGKKQVTVQPVQAKPKGNFLTGMDPEKLSQWINLLSNPAVQDLLNQFMPKQPPPVQPEIRRRRRLFF